MRVPKTNRQLTAEVGRLRQRMAHLESYVIELSRWVLYEDEEVAAEPYQTGPEVAAWGPPLVGPPGLAPAIERVERREAPQLDVPLDATGFMAEMKLREWEAAQRDRDVVEEVEYWPDVEYVEEDDVEGEDVDRDWADDWAGEPEA